MSPPTWRRFEEGQALIQVTISLVVLLGFVALAVDVGRVYAERRNMQNAADAAALAGARELCAGKSKGEAELKGEEILRANGVTTEAAAGAVKVVGDNVVTAEGVFLDFSPIIGQLISWGAIEAVRATASASCGAATASCGLWPMTLLSSAWSELTINPTGTCVERTIAVWNDDEKEPDTGSKAPKPTPNPAKKIPYCKVDGNDKANLCECYQCPMKDGKEIFYLVASNGRAWLDFSSVADVGETVTPECQKNGSGTKELNCQILRSSVLKLDLPKCVDGIEGVRASTRDAVNDRAKVKDYVKIPLFDETCGGKKDAYHVTSFGCASPVGWYTLDNLLEELLGGKKNVPNIYQHGIPPKDFWRYDSEGKERDSIANNEKIILVKTDCGNRCVSACGTTDGTVAETGQVRAVSLIK